MKLVRVTFLAAVCFFGVSFSANSALIVDTGPGPSPWPGNAWVFGGSDHFAGQFQITENTTLSSIQGWMGINKDGGGFSFDIHVYSQVNGLPDQSLFSGSAFAPPAAGVPANESYGFGWYGLSGLNWSLQSGTYWVTFEGRDPMQAHALMPGPSVNPLAHYAKNSVVTNYAWQMADHLKLGVRIEGSPTAVPLPAALWLFGSGLFGILGLAARGRRSRV